MRGERFWRAQDVTLLLRCRSLADPKEQIDEIPTLKQSLLGQVPSRMAALKLVAAGLYRFWPRGTRPQPPAKLAGWLDDPGHGRLLRRTQ